MEQFIPPVQMMQNNYTYNTPAATVNDAAAQLSSVFMQQMLKEVFKSQTENDLFGAGSGNQFFSDAMMNQMIDQLAKEDAFGFNSLIAQQISENKTQ